jgi:lipopolysaccharide transport system permease protein
MRRIGPERDGFVQTARDLASRASLIRAVTRREVRVRYKQTLLGVLWAVAYPLALMLIFTLVFSRFVGLSSEGHPYALFAYVGLLPWTFFSTATTLATRSLVDNVPLVTKVWFPREVLPLASVLASLFDFAVAFALLLVLCLPFGVVPAWTWLFVAPLVVIQLALTVGFSLFMAALNVRYRDVKFIVPLVMQVWLYASPVIYSLSEVPERWRTLYALNPMVGLIQGYRQCLLDGLPPSGLYVALAAAGAFVWLALGWWYFHRVEVHFADVI